MVRCEVYGCSSAHTLRRDSGHDLCDRHEDATLFMDLRVGDIFTVETPYSYNLRLGKWRKIKGGKNPAYPNLHVNAERVEKTGRSYFGDGDLDWTWMGANFHVRRA